MENNKWILHISPLNTIDELKQYLVLWEELRAAPRDVNTTDEIEWRWAQDGQYTTQSGYKIQFVGGRMKISMCHIWRAKTEPKVKIFAWMLLQYKILTTNPQCKLCNSGSETPSHLCLECNFTREV
jgi:hypothetical protein